MKSSQEIPIDDGPSSSSTSPRNFRPTTTSTFARKPSVNFKTLGRTKSLLMNSKPSSTMDHLTHKVDTSMKLNDTEDEQSLALGESDRYQTNKRGSFRAMFHTLKSKTSRHPAGETSTFQRLFGSKKCRRDTSLEIGEHDMQNTTKPGNGNEPPLIPQSGGIAARANAAASNFYWQNRNRPFGNLEDNQGDRESGIGIATAASTASFQQEVVEPESVTRVDFLQRLPNELVSQILSHLDLRSLLAVELVSWCWNHASHDRFVWRDVFFQDKSVSIATGKQIAAGAGLGLPDPKPAKDWKNVYKVRRQLEQNWKKGTAHSIYLYGHLDSIYCVQFDENKIITGSRDKTIRIWDLETERCTMVIGCPSVLADLENVPIQEAQVVPPQWSTVISDRGFDSTPKKVSFPINHNASILCLQYDDEILVTGSSDSTSIVHDIKNGYQPIMRLQQHTLAVLDLAFDQNYIVTCSKDTTICVWDRKTGQLIKQLRGHTGPVNAIQLRGNSIVSCSGDTVVKLWNIDSGRIVREFQGHKKGLACSQFSDDSKLIASAGNDKTIRIWDANTGELRHEIEAHNNLVRSLHIDSITGRLVSGSYDQDIKVWDLHTGQLVLDFPKWHASWVLAAKCDYRRIVSTGQDPKILIMDFGHDVDGIELLESTQRSAERSRRDTEKAEAAMKKLAD